MTLKKSPGSTEKSTKIYKSHSSYLSYSSNMSNPLNQNQFQSPAMKVPIIFHGTGPSLIKEDLLKQLVEAAKNPPLFHHISVLSEVHSKKVSRFPAGTIAASQNYLFPQLIDAAPNCGMRMLITDLETSEVSPEKIKALFEKLRSAVPSKKLAGVSVTQEITLEIFRQGSKAVVDHSPFRVKNELKNTMNGGNMFNCLGDDCYPSIRDIRNVIPSFILKLASRRLGILGATGSHFVYLMKVNKIFDADIARKFNLSAGKYIIFMHTGSGIVGRLIASLYAPMENMKFLNKLILSASQIFFGSQMKKVFQHLRKKLKLASEEKELFAYEDQSIEGRMFIAAHRAAANYGFANRAVVSHIIDKTMEQIFQRKIETELLYDAPHVYIEKEKHYGKDAWIHRNGANRALGPAAMKNHNLFSQTGEPVFVAPLENTFAYLGVGTDKNESAFFSANHEFGKAEEINFSPPAESSETSGYSFDIYTRKGKIKEKQNKTYQNYAEKTIEELGVKQIMKPVASFEPVAKLTC